MLQRPLSANTAQPAPGAHPQHQQGLQAAGPAAGELCHTWHYEILQQNLSLQAASNLAPFPNLIVPGSIALSKSLQAAFLAAAAAHADLTYLKITHECEYCSIKRLMHLAQNEFIAGNFAKNPKKLKKYDASAGCKFSRSWYRQPPVQGPNISGDNAASIFLESSTSYFKGLPMPSNPLSCPEGRMGACIRSAVVLQIRCWGPAGLQPPAYRTIWQSGYSVGVLMKTS